MARAKPISRIRRFINRKDVRVAIAWTLFWGSLIGWPLSLWLTDEPPFILSLSWLALTLTAWDIVNTSELH